MFDWVAVPVVHDDDSTANVAAAMAVIQNAVIFIMRVFFANQEFASSNANIRKAESRSKVYFDSAEAHQYMCAKRKYIQIP